MDKWMPSAPDGAFERFLTAAIATIITIIFSWRMLDKINDDNREDEDDPERHRLGNFSSQSGSSSSFVSFSSSSRVDAGARGSTLNPRHPTDIQSRLEKYNKFMSQGAQSSPTTCTSDELSEERTSFLVTNRGHISRFPVGSPSPVTNLGRFPVDLPLCGDKDTNSKITRDGSIFRTHGETLGVSDDLFVPRDTTSTGSKLPPSSVIDRTSPGARMLLQHEAGARGLVINADRSSTLSQEASRGLDQQGEPECICQENTSIIPGCACNKHSASESCTCPDSTNNEDFDDITDSSLDDCGNNEVDNNFQLFLNFNKEHGGDNTRDDIINTEKHHQHFNNQNIETDDGIFDNFTDDFLTSSSSDAHYRQYEEYDDFDDVEPRELDSDEELFCCSLLEPIIEENSEDMTTSSEGDNNSIGKVSYNYMDPQFNSPPEYDQQNRGFTPETNIVPGRVRIHNAFSSVHTPLGPACGLITEQRAGVVGRKYVSHSGYRTADLDIAEGSLNDSKINPTTDLDDKNRAQTEMRSGVTRTTHVDTASAQIWRDEDQADSETGRLIQNTELLDRVTNPARRFERDSETSVSEFSHVYSSSDNVIGDSNKDCEKVGFENPERVISPADIERFRSESFLQTFATRFEAEDSNSESDESVQTVVSRQTSREPEGSPIRGHGVSFNSLRPGLDRIKRPSSDGFLYSPNKWSSSEKSESAYRVRNVSEGSGFDNIGEEINEDADLRKGKSDFDFQPGSYKYYSSEDLHSASESKIEMTECDSFKSDEKEDLQRKGEFQSEENCGSFSQLSGHSRSKYGDVCVDLAPGIERRLFKSSGQTQMWRSEERDLGDSQDVDVRDELGQYPQEVFIQCVDSGLGYSDLSGFGDRVDRMEKSGYYPFGGEREFRERKEGYDSEEEWNEEVVETFVLPFSSERTGLGGVRSEGGVLGGVRREGGVLGGVRREGGVLGGVRSERDVVEGTRGGEREEDLLDRRKGDLRIEDLLDGRRGDLRIEDLLDERIGDLRIEDLLDGSRGDGRVDDLLDGRRGDGRVEFFPHGVEEEDEWREDVVETFVLPLSHEGEVFTTMQGVKDMLDERSAGRSSEVVAHDDDVDEDEFKSTCTTTMIEVEGEGSLGFRGQEDVLSWYRTQSKDLARVDTSLKERFGFKLNLDEYKTDDYSTADGWPVVRLVERERVFVDEVGDDGTLSSQVNDDDFARRMSKTDEGDDDGQHLQSGFPDLGEETRHRHGSTGSEENENENVSNNYKEGEKESVIVATFPEMAERHKHPESSQITLPPTRINFPVQQTSVLTTRLTLTQFPLSSSSGQDSKIWYDDNTSSVFEASNLREDDSLENIRILQPSEKTSFHHSIRETYNTDAENPQYRSPSGAEEGSRSLKYRSPPGAEEAARSLQYRSPPGAEEVSRSVQYRSLPDEEDSRRIFSVKQSHELYVKGLNSSESNIQAGRESESNYTDFVRNISGDSPVPMEKNTSFMSHPNSAIISGNVSTDYSSSYPFDLPTETQLRQETVKPPTWSNFNDSDEEDERREKPRNELWNQNQDSAMAIKPIFVRTSTAQSEEELLGVKVGGRESSSGSMHEDEASSGSFSLERSGIQSRGLNWANIHEDESNKGGGDTSGPEFFSQGRSVSEYHSQFKATSVDPRPYEASEAPLKLGDEFRAFSSSTNISKPTPASGQNLVGISFKVTKFIPGSTFVVEKHIADQNSQNASEYRADVTDNFQRSSLQQDHSHSRHVGGVDFADGENVHTTTTTRNSSQSTTVLTPFPEFSRVRSPIAVGSLKPETEQRHLPTKPINVVKLPLISMTTAKLATERLSAIRGVDRARDEGGMVSPSRGVDRARDEGVALQAEYKNRVSERQEDIGEDRYRGEDENERYWGKDGNEIYTEEETNIMDRMIRGKKDDNSEESSEEDYESEEEEEEEDEEEDEEDEERSESYENKRQGTKDIPEADTFRKTSQFVESTDDVSPYDSYSASDATSSMISLDSVHAQQAYPTTSQTAAFKPTTMYTPLRNTSGVKPMFSSGSPKRAKSMKEIKKRYKQPYKSVLNLDPSTLTPPKAAPFVLPDHFMTPSRTKIVQSRNTFLSEQNLHTSSFTDDFADHKKTPKFTSSAGKNRMYKPKLSRHGSYRSQEQLEKIKYMISLKPGRSEGSLSAACLHDDCILSEEGRREILDKTLSIDNLDAHLHKYLQKFNSHTDRQHSDSFFPETNSDLFDLTFPFQDDLDRYINRPSSMGELHAAYNYSTISGSGMKIFDSSRSRPQDRHHPRDYNRSKSVSEIENNNQITEFASGKENIHRPPSAHDLRISKSLQKLNAPSWYMKSSRSHSGGSIHYSFSANSPSAVSPTATYSTPTSLTNVIIKSRVKLPSSTRNLRSPHHTTKSAPVTPSFPTSTHSGRLHTTSPVPLPSDKFRTMAKPQSLQPIPIVPFNRSSTQLEQKKDHEAKQANPEPQGNASKSSFRSSNASQFSSPAPTRTDFPESLNYTSNNESKRKIPQSAGSKTNQSVNSRKEPKGNIPQSAKSQPSQAAIFRDGAEFSETISPPPDPAFRSILKKSQDESNYPNSQSLPREDESAPLYIPAPLAIFQPAPIMTLPQDPSVFGSSKDQLPFRPPVYKKPETSTDQLPFRPPVYKKPETSSDQLPFRPPVYKKPETSSEQLPSRRSINETPKTLSDLTVIRANKNRPIPAERPKSIELKQSDELKHKQTPQEETQFPNEQITHDQFSIPVAKPRGSIKSVSSSSPSPSEGTKEQPFLYEINLNSTGPSFDSSLDVFPDPPNSLPSSSNIQQTPTIIITPGTPRPQTSYPASRDPKGATMTLTKAPIVRPPYQKPFIAPVIEDQSPSEPHTHYPDHPASFPQWRAKPPESPEEGVDTSFDSDIVQTKPGAIIPKSGDFKRDAVQQHSGNFKRDAAKPSAEAGGKRSWVPKSKSSRRPKSSDETEVPEDHIYTKSYEDQSNFELQEPGYTSRSPRSSSELGSNRSLTDELKLSENKSIKSKAASRTPQSSAGQEIPKRNSQYDAFASAGVRAPRSQSPRSFSSEDIPVKNPRGFEHSSVSYSSGSSGTPIDIGHDFPYEIRAAERKPSIEANPNFTRYLDQVLDRYSSPVIGPSSHVSGLDSGTSTPTGDGDHDRVIDEDRGYNVTRNEKYGNLASVPEMKRWDSRGYARNEGDYGRNVGVYERNENPYGRNEEGYSRNVRVYDGEEEASDNNDGDLDRNEMVSDKKERAYARVEVYDSRDLNFQRNASGIYIDRNMGYGRREGGFGRPEGGFDREELDYDQEKSGYDIRGDGYDKGEPGYESNSDREEKYYDQRESVYGKGETDSYRGESGSERGEINYDHGKSGFGRGEGGYDKREPGYESNSDRGEKYYAQRGNGSDKITSGSDRDELYYSDHGERSFGRGEGGFDRRQVNYDRGESGSVRDESGSERGEIDYGQGKSGYSLREGGYDNRGSGYNDRERIPQGTHRPNSQDHERTPREDTVSSIYSDKDVLREEEPERTPEFRNRDWVMPKGSHGDPNMPKDGRRDSNLSRDSRNDLNVSIDISRDSNLPRDSRRDSNLSRGSKKDSNLSRDSRKDSNLSRDSKIDSNSSIDSRRNSNMSRDSRRDSNWSRGSKKDSNLSLDSRRDSTLSNDTIIDHTLPSGSKCHKRSSSAREEPARQRTSTSSGRSWQPKSRKSRGASSSPKRATSAGDVNVPTSSLGSNGGSNTSPYMYRVEGSAFNSTRPRAVAGLSASPSGSPRFKSVSMSSLSTETSESRVETTV